MSSGHTDLDAMIANLRSLGPALTTDAAPEVARALRADLERTTAAQTTPDGRAWAPRKSGGTTPLLANAAKAVGVTAMGATVVFVLQGVEARHHRGRVKGGQHREILPRAGLPRGWAVQIERVLARRFEAWRTGGGGDG